MYEPLFAPTKEILDAYKKRGGAWEAYERSFVELMAQRQIEQHISPRIFDMPTVLLCSENTAEHCHRRLVMEYLRDKWGNLEIIHL